MNIGNILHYIRVYLHEMCVIFGGIESVANHAFIPDNKLHKRHIALSLHIVRESIVARVMTLKFFQAWITSLIFFSDTGAINKY